MPTGNTISNFLSQANGTPQGSILSPTLFIIAISDITTNIPANVNSLIYADDIVIYMKSKNQHLISQTLQRSIINLKAWAELNGHSFSAQKTKYMIFTRK